VEEVHWLASAQPMLNTLLGGVSSFWGPVVGAGLFAAIAYATRTLLGLSELIVGTGLTMADTVATLQFAKAVQGHFGSIPLPETTSHVMSPDEAAQQLHPGHITQAGAGHIAIDMESLSPKKSDPAESSSAGQERPVRDQPASASASASGKGKAPMVDDGKSA
jgi:hypothetical protein